MDKLSSREGFKDSSMGSNRDISAYVWCALVSLILGCLQTGFFAELPLFGTAPDLSLAFVVAVAMRWGAKRGTAAGLSAGIVMSALSSGSYLTLPFYFALGVIVGVLFEGSARRGFIPYHITAGAAALLRVSAIFFELCLFMPSFGFTAAITKLILPNLAATILFSPIFYLIAAERRERSK